MYESQDGGVFCYSGLSARGSVVSDAPGAGAWGEEDDDEYDEDFEDVEEDLVAGYALTLNP